MTRARATAFCLLVLPACTGSTTPHVPLPDLADAEPAVATAVEHARAAVVARPADAMVWAALGDRLRSHEWLEEAAECYARAERLDPGEFRWPYLAAKALAASDPRGAATALERALALDPDYALAHLYYARLAVQLGDFARARSHFERVRQLDQGVAALGALGLAQLHLAREEHEAALAMSRSALELRPSDGRVHLALAQAAMALGRGEEARRHADAGRRLLRRERLDDPRDTGVVEPAGSAALGARGRRLADRNRLAEAEDLLRESVRLNPRLAGSQYALGIVLMRQQRIDEAIGHLRRAVRLKPSYAPAHAALGHALVTREDGLVEGLDQLREAVRLDPGDHQSRTTILAVTGGAPQRVAGRLLDARDPAAARGRVR